MNVGKDSTQPLQVHPPGDTPRAQPILVLITAPGEDAAMEIAHMLVEQKLAACVNILPHVRSVYAWKGELHEDVEWLLIAKSWQELFKKQLLPAVKEMHPYEVPEIVAVEVSEGLPEYLAWMDEATREE